MPKKQLYGTYVLIPDQTLNNSCTQLAVPSYPPLWTKPAASLAHPDEDIQVNDFCAKSLLDYEVTRYHFVHGHDS